MQGGVLISTVLTLRPQIRQCMLLFLSTNQCSSTGIFLITLGTVYVNMEVLLLVAWVLVSTRQGIGIAVLMGV